jgi:hypothetical protein
MKKECAEKSKDVMGAMDGKKTQAGLAAGGVPANPAYPVN